MTKRLKFYVTENLSDFSNHLGEISCGQFQFAHILRSILSDLIKVTEQLLEIFQGGCQTIKLSFASHNHSIPVN